MPDIESGFPFSLATAVAESTAGDLRNKYQTEHKFGVHFSLGTSLSTVWAGSSSIFSYPTTPQITTVSSTDTDDESGGPGARTVEVRGLSGTYRPTFEVVALDGQTPVTLANSYIRINDVIVRTAGAAGWNGGTVYVGTGTVTAGVPATVCAAILPTYNRAMQTMFTVPAGRNAFINRLYLSVDNSRSMTAFLVVRRFEEVFVVETPMIVFQNAYVYDFAYPLPVPERSDIEVRASVDGSMTTVAAGYELLLIRTGAPVPTP